MPSPQTDEHDVEDPVDEPQVMTSFNTPIGNVWCKQHVKTHETSIMLHINEQEFCALIDTGAQVSCLTFSVE